MESFLGHYLGVKLDTILKHIGMSLKNLKVQQINLLIINYLKLIKTENY